MISFPVTREQIWELIANSDEFTLLVEISSTLSSLADLRILAILLVSVYLFLWFKLEAIAATRADAERKQAEASYGCAGRRSLEEIYIQKHGNLYGSYSFLDAFLNVVSRGRHLIRMDPMCSMRSAGVLWRTRDLTVHATPANEVLAEQARKRSRKNASQALHSLRVGGTLLVLDNEISRNFQQVSYYVNCDDPDCFVSLFEDATLSKRLNYISARQLIDAVVDFEKKTITLSQKAGLVVFKHVQHFYSFAIIAAHLTYNNPR